MNTWTIQVTAGAGPREVRQFVGLLAHRLAQDIVAAGLIVDDVVTYGDSAAPRSVQLHVEGNVAGVIGGQVGTHVLLARSQARGRSDRKRWFAGVSVHQALQQTATRLDIRDLEICTARAGGPGGQHVNTTSSAVRVRHKPTGVCVRATSERSQHLNRALALRRLAAILDQRAAAQLGERRGHVWQSHYHFERGTAVGRWTLDRRGQSLRRA